MIDEVDEPGDVFSASVMSLKLKLIVA